MPTADVAEKRIRIMISGFRVKNAAGRRPNCYFYPMSKKQVILIHVVACIVYTAYEIIGYFIRVDAKPLHLYLGLSFAFVRIVQFYYCYLLIFPLFGTKNKLAKLTIGLLSAFALFIILRYTIEEVLFPYFLGFDNYNDLTTATLYIGDNIYWGSPGITIAAIVWSIVNASRRERENKQLRQEVTRAELAFLKSQINPHFLYNSLNYIYSLALPVSDKLASAVLHLSDLMRYTLKESADGKVKLQQEVIYIRSYIELFRMRFAPEFYVNFETSGVDDSQAVASLVLIPFVENTFKHGVFNEAERPVRIKLTVINNRLTFTVSNKINRSQKDHSSGVGLVNIKRRLELLYPGRHELLISDNGQTYKTTLYITLA